MTESSSKTSLYFNFIFHEMYALLLSQLAHMLDIILFFFVLFKIKKVAAEHRKLSCTM